MNDELDPDPVLAYHDGRFVESDDGRPLRILAEYLQPMQALARERVHDTIVFFGDVTVSNDAQIRCGAPRRPVGMGRPRSLCDRLGHPRGPERDQCSCSPCALPVDDSARPSLSAGALPPPS